ncbi:MAG: AAA family ATPase, partial [Candidatus Binatia bacterium]
RWAALRERFALGDAEGEQAQDLPAGIRQRAGLALSTLHQPRVLFLDEPTAGVDVHSRALFWTLIQEEAAAGVTVFVTTHFLEEADYCDWVCFIDGGRVIANAAPETLRRRHSDGYRLEAAVTPEERATAVRILSTLGSRIEHAGSGVRCTVAALDPLILAVLNRLAAECHSARIHIEQPQMTDVFRRLLAATANAA